MSFSAHQLDQYREEGFTAVPDFFSAREVAAMHAELDRLTAAGLLRNVATTGDGRTISREGKNLQIVPLTPKSEFFRALPFEGKVVGAVARLIGEPFVLYLDQIFLKPGRSGGGTAWHQDNAYFGVDDPTRGVGMWIAIHEATEANGTIHVVPGGHRRRYDHERDLGSNHHIRCVVDEGQARCVELPAGGALFFNFAVPHCTRANRTDSPRAGLALHFLHADHIPAHTGRGGARVSPVLCGPEATGGRKEYGAHVAGTWTREIERVLTGQEQGAPAATS